MPLIARNLSLSNTDTRVLLHRADEDCHSYSPAEVETWLTDSMNLGTLVGLTYRFVPSNSAIDAYFAESAWLSRALVAFQEKRSLMTNPAPIEAWLRAQAGYLDTMLNFHLAEVLPARASDDYTSRASVAIFSPLHMTSTMLVLGGPLIPTLALYYNNRRATQAYFIGMCGFYYNVTAWTETAKRYVREWIMFGTWEGGIQSEHSRDDDYGQPHQGFSYGAMNIALAMMVSARSQLIGDTSLLNYSTMYGHGGTESTTPKTIWSALDYWMDCAEGTRTHTTRNGTVVNCHGGGALNLQSRHPHYFLEEVHQLDPAVMGPRVINFLNQPIASGNSADFGAPAWSGFFGVSSTDVREGIMLNVAPTSAMGFSQGVRLGDYLVTFSGPSGHPHAVYIQGS